MSTVGVLRLDQFEPGIVGGSGPEDFADVARETDLRRGIGERQSDQGNQQKGGAREAQCDQPDPLKTKSRRHQAQSLPGRRVPSLVDIVLSPRSGHQWQRLV